MRCAPEHAPGVLASSEVVHNHDVFAVEFDSLISASATPASPIGIKAREGWAYPFPTGDTHDGNHRPVMS